MGVLGSGLTGLGNVPTSGESDRPGSGLSTALLGWEAGQLAIAQNRLRGIQGYPLVNRSLATDFCDGNYILADAFTVVVPGKSGGVWSFPSDVNLGAIYLGPVVDQKLIAFPSVEPWYVSALVTIAAGNIAAGKFVVPIQLFDGASSIYVVLNPATLQLEVNLYDGADHLFSMGAVGLLGSATAPLGAMFTIALWYHPAQPQSDGTTRAVLVAECSGETAVELTAADLVTIATGPCSVDMFAKSAAAGFEADAMFAAWSATP